ncbi:hypothetical protein OQJ19_04805 [Fluoribacter gormanii]|uniref:Uncharacterized protein n=1 Tax=Fluoribacter gormanii TaxID=464 RepID=A0A377GH11_9GAMM|nr:hypothetical protein [Fluoribacter gormanii]KTD02426.1 hypothetical protein Lgor_1718 [Fluoribacter gormanii]MCW8469977.1 hypothetical protein [Fluoribacter gormanii]SIR68419.1 hypothetical protein SAMN05421777_11925 [Fluoribacter gormanii]STO23672.1 Uncharacterised protein [Fluoribacter gormanii]
MMMKYMFRPVAARGSSFFQSSSLANRAYSTPAYRVKLMEKDGDRIGVITSKENNPEKLSKLKEELAAKDYEVYSVTPEEIMVVQSKAKFLKDINDAAGAIEENTSNFKP